MDTRPIQHNYNGERCFSRFATADLFSHIYSEVQEVYGENVFPICLQISFDGTDISGGGGSKAKSATPCNIRVLNVSENAFSSKENTLIVGFLPEITAS